MLIRSKILLNFLNNLIFWNIKDVLAYSLDYNYLMRYNFHQRFPGNIIGLFRLRRGGADGVSISIVVHSEH